MKIVTEGKLSFICLNLSDLTWQHLSVFSSTVKFKQYFKSGIESFLSPSVIDSAICFDQSSAKLLEYRWSPIIDVTCSWNSIWFTSVFQNKQKYNFIHLSSSRFNGYLDEFCDLIYRKFDSPVFCYHSKNIILSYLKFIEVLIKRTIRNQDMKNCRKNQLSEGWNVISVSFLHFLYLH